MDNYFNKEEQIKINVYFNGSRTSIRLHKRIIDMYKVVNGVNEDKALREIIENKLERFKDIIIAKQATKTQIIEMNFLQDIEKYILKSKSLW